MNKNVIFYFALLFILSNSVYSQKTGDSLKTIPMFSASYMLQIPGNDLAKRYGINSNIGGSFMLKLKNNALFEINANFIFGGTLKGDAAHLFDSISTVNGELINEYGEFAKLRTFERGFFVGSRFGKVFNVCKKNVNSGIVFSVGAGLLYHKVRIENDGNNLPQILGEYKKGYDKMCYGFSSTEFIGYMYFSKKYFFNFYTGFEFYQGFTKSGRSYDYSLMKKDTSKRIDLLSSVKIGWIIPLYRRMPEEFYYY